MQHLREIIRSYPHFSQKADNSTNLLIGHSALQLALIVEGSFHPKLPKNIVMPEEMHLCATVAKAIGQKLDDKTLYEPAEQIFQHLRLVNPKKPSGTETFYLRPDSPLDLQIEPTNYCNLRCRMCSHEKMTRKKGYMDVSLFKEIFTGWGNKCSEFSIRHLIHGIEIPLLFKRWGNVKLYFMGEPLLHPQLEKLVTIAKEADTLVGIQTNGVLLEKPQVRSKLLTSQPHAGSLSLDGINEETFETVRKGTNWQRICEGIKAFHKERENMKLADSISVSISTIIPEDTEENRQQALNFLRPLRPFVDEIYFIYLDCKYAPYFFNPEGAIKKYEYTPPASFSENLPLCTEPLGKLNILWDGTITPCCKDFDAKIPLGNVTEGVDAVWEGDKTKSLHEALLNHDLHDFPFCQGCIGFPARS